MDISKHFRLQTKINFLAPKTCNTLYITREQVFISYVRLRKFTSRILVDSCVIGFKNKAKVWRIMEVLTIWYVWSIGMYGGINDTKERPTFFTKSELPCLRTDCTMISRVYVWRLFLYTYSWKWMVYIRESFHSIFVTQS